MISKVNFKEEVIINNSTLENAKVDLPKFLPIDSIEHLSQNVDTDAPCGLIKILKKWVSAILEIICGFFGCGHAPAEEIKGPIASSLPNGKIYSVFKLKGIYEDSQPRPLFLEPILSGNSGSLQTDRDFAADEFENWGKSEFELEYLGECSCPTLSRPKHPEIKQQFENYLVDRVVQKANQKNQKTIILTDFASGYLFSPFVYIVQLTQCLENRSWEGTVILNVIDTKFQSLFGAEGNEDSQNAIQNFCKSIVKILSRDIQLELNIFASAEDYIEYYKHDEREVDCAIGQDLSEVETNFYKLCREIVKGDGFGINLRKIKNDNCTEAVVDFIGMENNHLQINQLFEAIYNT